MEKKRVYADPQKVDDHGRLILTTIGTRRDLSRHGIALTEGMAVDFWNDDADAEGNLDPLVFSGVVSYDSAAGHWVATIDDTGYRHASDLLKDQDRPA